MPDRHKTKPLSLRLPEALSAWVEQQAQATGKPVRRVILDTLWEAASEDGVGGEAVQQRSQRP